MRVFLAEDDIGGRSVVPEMVARIGGLQLVGRARGGREALAWLQRHPAQWDLTIVDLQQDSTQLDVVDHARRLHPLARIVVFSSLRSLEIRGECVRRGADAAFHKMRAGDFASWLDRLARRSAADAPCGLGREAPRLQGRAARC